MNSLKYTNDLTTICALDLKQLENVNLIRNHDVTYAHCLRKITNAVLGGEFTVSIGEQDMCLSDKFKHSMFTYLKAMLDFYYATGLIVCKIVRSEDGMFIPIVPEADLSIYVKTHTQSKQQTFHARTVSREYGNQNQSSNYNKGVVEEQFDPTVSVKSYDLLCSPDAKGAIRSYLIKAVPSYKRKLKTEEIYMAGVHANTFPWTIIEKSVEPNPPQYVPPQRSQREDEETERRRFEKGRQEYLKRLSEQYARSSYEIKRVKNALEIQTMNSRIYKSCPDPETITRGETIMDLRCGNRVRRLPSVPIDIDPRFEDTTWKNCIHAMLGLPPTINDIGQKNSASIAFICERDAAHRNCYNGIARLMEGAAKHVISEILRYQVDNVYKQASNKNSTIDGELVSALMDINDSLQDGDERQTYNYNANNIFKISNNSIYKIPTRNNKRKRRRIRCNDDNNNERLRYRKEKKKQKKEKEEEEEDEEDEEKKTNVQKKRRNKTIESLLPNSEQRENNEKSVTNTDTETKKNDAKLEQQKDIDQRKNRQLLEKLVCEKAKNDKNRMKSDSYLFDVLMGRKTFHNDKIHVTITPKEDMCDIPPAERFSVLKQGNKNKKRSSKSRRTYRMRNTNYSKKYDAYSDSSSESENDSDN